MNSRSGGKVGRDFRDLGLALLTAVVFMLGGCGVLFTKSDLFATLKRLSHQPGSFVLHSGETVRLMPLEPAVDDLVSDGFVLSVAPLPGLVMVTCGRYVVPLGDEQVILDRYANVFEPSYRVLVTVSQSCRVTHARGVRFPTTGP